MSPRSDAVPDPDDPAQAAAPEQAPPTVEGPAPVQAPARAARVRRPRPPALDAVCAAAVDLARAAAVEHAGEAAVGEHLGAVAEGERLVGHRFTCLLPGYRGWHWWVTLARASRARYATVCESCLLPGDDAILAPAWLEWQDRLRPGDVGAGDVLPYRATDERLDAGFEATGDEDADAVAIDELGLGRRRVLSALGRAEAAQRWYDGVHGPDTEVARAAAHPCATCGFLVRLAGSLRQAFGVCANEWSPSDGQVVSLDHGCGAHSESDVERESEPVVPPVLDEVGYHPVDVGR